MKQEETVAVGFLIIGGLLAGILVCIMFILHALYILAGIQ